jgi:hypothetical protein
LYPIAEFENVHSFFRASVVEFRTSTPERGSLARSYHCGMNTQANERWSEVEDRYNNGKRKYRVEDGISQQRIINEEIDGYKRESPSSFSSKLLTRTKFLERKKAKDNLPKPLYNINITPLYNLHR